MPAYGYPIDMTDYTEQGAIPVEDAAVDDPPTEAEVRATQAEQHPEQARTATGQPGPPTDGQSRHSVQFVLPPQVEADSIAVVGEFNDWSPTALVMERTDTGQWSATIDLPTGRYRYRYLIDGTRWENDWRADDYETNDFGGDDSVILVGPTGS